MPQVSPMGGAWFRLPLRLSCPELRDAENSGPAGGRGLDGDSEPGPARPRRLRRALHFVACARVGSRPVQMSPGLQIPLIWRGVSFASGVIFSGLRARFREKVRTRSKGGKGDSRRRRLFGPGPVLLFRGQLLRNDETLGAVQTVGAFGKGEASRRDDWWRARGDRQGTAGPQAVRDRAIPGVLPARLASRIRPRMHQWLREALSPCSAGPRANRKRFARASRRARLGRALGNRSRPPTASLPASPGRVEAAARLQSLSSSGGA